MNQPCILENEDAGQVLVRGGEDDKQSRVLRIQCSRPHDSDSEGTAKHGTEVNMLKAKRLVINIGQQKVKVSEPLSSDASKLLTQLELVSNGHGLRLLWQCMKLEDFRKVRDITRERNSFLLC